MTDHYNPRRNLVTRHLDGKQVNVARVRGHLFVCANACCCGRTDLTNAPVPTEAYHDQWTGRRLRNFVHLTVGGCLGPCALANVALLVFEGQSTWFHSVNSEETVTAIFDHVEHMLDTGRHEHPAGSLADHAFTGYDWQPRPDGRDLDDLRSWRGRDVRPDGTPACELPPGALVIAPAQVALDTPDQPRSPLSDEHTLPRSNGELVFGAAWEGRAFGMAAALIESGDYTYDAFRVRLIEQIAAAEGAPELFDYYASWLAAVETILADRGLVSAAELAERTAEFEYGERQDVF